MNSQERNLKIIQVIPAFVLGGAETMCANLSIELVKSGHTVRVISLYNYESSITEQLKQNGIEVVFLNKKEGFQPSIIRSLQKQIRQFKPDVVHTHLYASKYAQIAALLTGVKVKVHTIHSVAQHSDGKANQILNSLLFRRFHVIPISLSEEVQKTVVDLYKIRPEKTPVVLNGVPVEKCIPVSDYPEKATKILHVGRFFKPKNHMELIRGFVKAHERDSDLQLYLYGEGELEQEAEKLVKQLHAEECIHFCGTTDNVYTVMNKADIFILPSLWEGVPMTIIEAMGTGLPIIASNVGGIPNMIANKVDGLLISPNSNELAETIIELAHDRQNRKKYGMSALKKSEAFSSRKMADNYLKIYGNSRV